MEVETITRVRSNNRADNSLVLDESRIREAEQRVTKSVKEVFEMFPTLAQNKSANADIG